MATSSPGSQMCVLGQRPSQMACWVSVPPSQLAVNSTSPGIGSLSSCCQPGGSQIGSCNSLLLVCTASSLQGPERSLSAPLRVGSGKPSPLALPTSGSAPGSGVSRQEGRWQGSPLRPARTHIPGQELGFCGSECR